MKILNKLFKRKKVEVSSNLIKINGVFYIDSEKEQPLIINEIDELLVCGYSEVSEEEFDKANKIKKKVIIDHKASWGKKEEIRFFTKQYSLEDFF